jgi:ATP-dependent exoDNAse (exonuclease V) beta subunit
LNPHPRDAQISFQDEGHLYTVQGVEGHPISVTTLIHTLFEPFDADVVIEKMMNSERWPESQYFDMSADEIKKLWDDNRDEAAKAGTAMHKTIEDFLNLPERKRAEALSHFGKCGYAPMWLPQTPEFSRFLAFWSGLTKEGLYVPYRTEWLVFDAEKRLAGSIDLILEERGTGNLVIVDWKRSKQIKYNNPFQSGKHCLRHLPDCNYVHYSMQLNIYRHLLETHYGKKVVDMYLVVLHPNNPTFVKVPIKRMETETAQVMERLPLAPIPATTIIKNHM